jgi:type I restriction enzyme S subunit
MLKTTNLVTLGTLIKPAKTIRCGNDSYPVLSMTMHNGLVFQDDKFKKEIASKDKSDYKVVYRNQLVVSFPIDEGVLAAQRIVDAGIVSPAYGIWDIDQSRIIPEFLENALRCERAIAYYKAKLRGSTARRRSLPTPTLLEFTVPLPSLEEQKTILKVVNKAKKVIGYRKQQLSALDDLIKARFVEMFGDPETNPKGWRKKPLSDVITAANNGMARRGNDEDGNIVMRLVELQDGYIDYSNPNRIVLTQAEKKRYLLNDKDFLFARVNGNPDNVGRCAVFYDIGEPVFHNDHIIRVHFNDNALDGPFASALLNSEYGKRQLRNQIKTSAGQYTVSQDGIGAIVAILPPLELQLQFAAFVAQIDKSKSVIQKSLDETQLLFDSLMQQYFG